MISTSHRKSPASGNTAQKYLQGIYVRVEDFPNPWQDTFSSSDEEINQIEVETSETNEPYLFDIRQITHIQRDI